jgi:hypothetical protein
METNATTNEHGQTVVTHPGAPTASVRIAPNAPRAADTTYGALAEEDGVLIPVFSGKSYKKPNSARRAADKWLRERAGRHAEDLAHPFVPLAPAPRAAWLDASDAITEEGFVAVHSRDSEGNVVVTRGARVLEQE